LEEFSNGPRSEVYEFNFESNKWTNRSPIPFGNRCSYSCQLLNEDTGIFYGGYEAQTKIYFNTIYKYHISLDLWEEIIDSSKSPVPTAYSSSTMMENIFYLFGGYSGNHVYSNGLSWMIFPKNVHLNIWNILQKNQINDTFFYFQ